MHGMNNKKATYCNSWVQRCRSPSYQVTVLVLAGHTTALQILTDRAPVTFRLLYLTLWPVLLTTFPLTELTGYFSHNPHRLSSADWWHSMTEEVNLVLVIKLLFSSQHSSIRHLSCLSSKPIIKTFSVSIRSAEKIFLFSAYHEHKP